MEATKLLSTNRNECYYEASLDNGFGMLNIVEEVDKILHRILDNGDPEVRSWFLVRQISLPFLLSATYAVFVTVLGPALMQHRPPFVLRLPMVIFNFTLVTTYVTALFKLNSQISTLGFSTFCYGGIVKKGELTYELAGWCWVLYVVKYVEFMDTVFLVLRKKNRMITFLHVFHHSVVPIIGWFMMRTETSGFQSIPVMVNAFVHVIMYSYYGLAAIGDHMKKYLWWKKYLTMLQMVQFVFFLVFVVVVAPASGCSVMPSSLWLDAVGGAAFLVLFANFYRSTFHRSKMS